MPDLPNEQTREAQGFMTPTLDDESRMEVCEFVDGVLIVRTEDACTHYVPEESLSRWSCWKDPSTQLWKIKIWTDSGALPVVNLPDSETRELMCAKLTEALGSDSAGWHV